MGACASKRVQPEAPEPPPPEVPLECMEEALAMAREAYDPVVDAELTHTRRSLADLLASWLLLPSVLRTIDGQGRIYLCAMEYTKTWDGYKTMEVVCDRRRYCNQWPRNEEFKGMLTAAFEPFKPEVEWCNGFYHGFIIYAVLPKPS